MIHSYSISHQLIVCRSAIIYFTWSILQNIYVLEIRHATDISCVDIYFARGSGGEVLWWARLSVCLSVHQDISGITRAISTSCSVHVAYGRGLVLPRQGDEMLRGRGSFGRFSFPLTMHCNALAAKWIIRSPITSCSRTDHSVAAPFVADGIGREAGDGSIQCGQSVIYDCFV